MHLTTVSLPMKKPLSHADIMDELHCIQFDNREVLIIIDDFTRPITPITRMVVEYAISEVGENKVAVVVASGLHRANTNHEVSEKIGPELTKRLRIYFHSPLCNFPLDRDKYNIIGVGCVMPHTFTGMSGDAKIVLPGLQTYENVMALHGSSRKSASDVMCAIKDNIDTYVNYTINSYGDPASIFVYSSNCYASEFRCDAWNSYTITLPDPADVAILIPRFKNVDFQQSMNAMMVNINIHTMESNDIASKCICIQSDTPEGIGVHYGFQHPNGVQPAYYDQVFEKQYFGVEICFICPNLPESAMQEYFRRQIFNFPSLVEFTKFVEERWGNTSTVACYHAADIMAGERE